MFNKITKLIEFGAIIWLNGLCVCGNRIDVFYEGGPTLVAEGIDGVELPTELSDPSHELWYEYGSKLEFIGIRLNFPEELIQDCEDKYWKIHDDALIQELEEIVSTEENFHNWCNKQEKIDYPDHNTRCIHAYILKKANEKNYLLSKDFCNRINLEPRISRIHLKGATLCLYGLAPKTPAGYYIRDLEWIMNYTFFEEESDEKDDASTTFSFFENLINSF